MDSFLVIGLVSGSLALISFGGAVRETIIIIIRQQLHM
jgi:hypothetical protein